MLSSEPFFVSGVKVLFIFDLYHGCDAARRSVLNDL
jgi:hypothetical protein